MKVPAGYTEDELELDNPYNQWLYGDCDEGPDDSDTTEPGICPDCCGSGKGMYEGTTCRTCKGRGES